MAVFREFADLIGNHDQVSFDAASLFLVDAYIRSDSFRRMINGVDTEVTRVYVTSNDDYEKLTAEFEDTFPVRKKHEPIC